jgi:hypothetical protein
MVEVRPTNLSEGGSTMTTPTMVLADVDEALVEEFVDSHLPCCHCATIARHPGSVRAALGHLIVVPRGADASPSLRATRRPRRHRRRAARGR